ncbi:MAG: anthranilate phosphoribosyltransferase [Candidatus Gastranaerophilaceae bacterium]|jgi:anthranilate phosphoribosyltransferase
MIKEVIKKLSENKNLSFEESRNFIDFISEGKVTSGQIGAFLTAITMKKPTVDEMAGFASRMREKANLVRHGFDNVVDSCGTGGDCANTFNISTTASILASASDLKVAKHSNFGITSMCGSSNVLQSLGIKLVETSEEAEKQLKNKGITFIHSPFFHKSTASVNPIRKEIGIRTVFNFIGPLVNPAIPTGQVLGVSSYEMCSVIIEVLKTLGLKKALVVHGVNPVIDEISICSETLIFRLENGKIDKFILKPEDFGVKTSNIENLKGSTPDNNAVKIKDILEGKIQGPCLDAVLINTAGLLWVGNKVSSLAEGVEYALNIVTSGKAKEKLDFILENQV